MAAIASRISGLARKVPSWAIYVLGSIPGAWLFWEAIVLGRYVDPVEALELQLGMLSLQFLIASLAITPMLRFARLNLLKFRKAFGLLAFGYLCLHFLTWLTLDLQFRWAMIGAEIVKRPYLTVGFVAFLLLIPLAATSWQGAIKRMGARGWGRLHRLVYVAVLLGAAHFVMQEKVWTVESLLYLTVASGLVAMRLLWIRLWWPR